MSGREPCPSLDRGRFRHRDTPYPMRRRRRGATSPSPACRRNLMMDLMPNLYTEYCRRGRHIAQRWDREYGLLYRDSAPRSRTVSPVYRPQYATDPEFLGPMERRRYTYNVTPGNCMYCHVSPCCCFRVTSQDRNEYRVRDVDERWLTLPYGCLQMAQARGLGSDPGTGMISYFHEDTLPPSADVVLYSSSRHTSPEVFYHG